jgi:hypothetical protein
MAMEASTTMKKIIVNKISNNEEKLSNAQSNTAIRFR